MGKDIKIFGGLTVLALVLILGLAVFSGSNNSETPETASQPAAEVAGVSVSPIQDDLGEVPINGGIVTREYELSNDTDSVMDIQKIVTSCMCTEAKIVTDDKETRFFGMEHPGDRNPPLNVSLQPGQSAQVVVNFDPAAHGPQGVGPFDRVVRIMFDEPAGYKNIMFTGTVVK